MAHAFVTGATGFIGRHLVETLRERGDEVTCLVRPASNRAALDAAGVRTAPGDILDRPSLVSPISHADVVYHLAALLKAPWRKDFADSHILGTRNVAEACAASPHPPTLVVVSSMAACGASVDGHPRAESDPPRPVSRYGRAKLQAERAVAELSGQVPMTIVRPPMVFGEGDRAALSLFKMAARRWFFSPALRPRSLSFIHARDLSDLLILAAERGQRVQPQAAQASAGIYNSAHPEPLRFAELGALIADVLGRRRPRVLRLPGPLLWTAGFLGELIGRLRDRPTILNLDKAREGTAGSWVCDTRKAQQELGFSPSVTTRMRLEQTAAWFRAEGWLA